MKYLIISLLIASSYADAIITIKEKIINNEKNTESISNHLHGYIGNDGTRQEELHAGRLDARR